MSRGIAAAVVGVMVMLTACSGGGGGSEPFADAPACLRLAQLAQTGQTVGSTNVADPAAFDATLRAATKKYVRTARSLRAALPVVLRDDVDLMIAAAQQRQFANAIRARARIDAWARTECKTPK